MSNNEIANLRREVQRLKQDVALRPIRVPVRNSPSNGIRIRIGRGNTVYTGTGLTVYGSKADKNPVSVSAGMWDAINKVWIPANSTWDDGICYGYNDGGAVVAVAQKFNGVTGAIGNLGALIEGGIIYSMSFSTYVLAGDKLTIYHVDGF